ncbi:MAG: uroporphyrinogen-III synthase [Pirellulales bacterium]|nr:uroporphyrinogen-III synthase [Pirellulales bacterium]
MQHAPCDRLPLEGTRVMVARAENKNLSDPLARRLRELGAEVVQQPAIRISPPADWRPVDEAIARLDRYDWLVFSSANGVRYFFDRCEASERRLPTPFPRVAVIGPGTAEELTRCGRQADLVPNEYRAEALADALIEQTGRQFLLLRASRGREVLAERLTAAGAEVDQVVVYASSDVERPEPEVAAMLAAGRIDWIAVTSSAIARSLAQMFGDDLRRARLASISPITSGALRELGHPPAAEAAEYTMAGLTDAILSFRR